MFIPEFWLHLSYVHFFALIVTANFLMYVLTALIVFLIRKYFIRFDLNFQNQNLSRKELRQSLLVVLANIFVGLVGFAMLKMNFISLTNKTFPFTLLHFFAIFFLIDFGMYFSHLFVHKTILYKWLHQDHHAHESMSLLSLYVMHPLEALAFGGILIGILSAYTIDLSALFAFLFFNWILGVFAHSGIEPSQGQWGNYICMTRFHQIHHESHDANYGFFTPLMDMLFKTRKYGLKSEVKRPTL